MPLIPVEVGQVRLDPDPRTEGKRRVYVEKVDGRVAYVFSSAGRHTSIALHRLEHWPLVTPEPTREQP